MELRRQLDRVRGRARVLPWLACGVGVVALGAAVAVKDFTPRGVLVVPVAVVVPVSAVEPAAVEVEEAAPSYEVGSCADDPGTGGCDPEQAGALRTLVTDWLAGAEWPRPGIELRSGVIFIDQPEPSDSPDRPDPPTKVMRVCGRPATWLRSHLRDEMRQAAINAQVWCGDTTCCFGGYEYTPERCVRFRHQGDDPETAEWIIVSWSSFWDIDRHDEYTADDRRLALARRRLAGTRCHGEPRGTD